MAFSYVDELVMAVLNFCQDREVVMVGKVAGLNVKLIENFLMLCMESPHLNDVRIFELPN